MRWVLPGGAYQSYVLLQPEGHALLGRIHVADEAHHLVALSGSPFNPLANQCLRSSYDKLRLFRGVGQDGSAIGRIGLMAVVAPEGIVPIRIFVGDASIELGREGQRCHPIQRRHHHSDGGPIGVGHAAEALRFKPDFCPIGHDHRTGSGEDAALHVQPAFEVLHFTRVVQVKRDPIDGNAHMRPVGCIQDLGEIFRIAILPPTDLGTIGVIHPTYIAPKHVVARVPLLEVGTLAEPAIAKGENAL